MGWFSVTVSVKGLFPFSASCELHLTLAGGYSAYMLLPGRDAPGQGSMAMLDGGNWCSRRVKEGFMENQIIQVNLISYFQL